MRGFLGGFGGNKNTGSGSSASADMKKQLLKGGKTQETPQEKMKKMIDEKRDAMMGEVLAGKGKKFQLPGTKQAEGGMSKSAKKMMEMIAKKKAVEKMKAEAQAVAIKKRNYNGGYMDENGKVYNAQGKVVGVVDMKNGNIKNSMGMTIGKFKDDFFGNGKIQKMIAASAPKPGVTGGSIYGTMSTPSSGGSIYGTFDDKKDDSWW